MIMYDSVILDYKTQLCYEITPHKVKMWLYYNETGISVKLHPIQHQHLSAIISKLIEIEREVKIEKILIKKIKELKHDEENITQ